MDWIILSIVLLVTWGIFGLFLKLTTNFVSAQSAFIWMSLGLLLITPVMITHVDLDQPLDQSSMLMGVMAGVASGLGTLTIFAAMRNEGKASIVISLTALYSTVTVVLAPLLFNEALTLKSVSGAILSLAAVILLSK